METPRDSAGHGELGLPCSLYRGGTSRGVMFRGCDLPWERPVVEAILLHIFGSPDSRQIDGVGGGTSQSSKAMIVEPSSTPDDDVLMTFAQVSVDWAQVDWGGNCGNMTAAVGPFAIEAGLVTPVEPFTPVRVRSVNTGKRVIVHVPVKDGRVVSDGDFHIPGVPNAGARVDLEWLDPAGAVTGGLLPTGRVRDMLELVDGRRIEVSIVDAVNPVVFCAAADLGLTGLELPDELFARPEVCDVLEQIRSAAAALLGLASSCDVATAATPGVPKVAFVASPSRYRTTGGAVLEAASHDLQGRLMSMQAPHRSYAVSGGICTAAAAVIAGTVVHGAARVAAAGAPIRIAHPYGVLDVALVVEPGSSGSVAIRSARVGRTARRIMSGLAFVPARLLSVSEHRS